MDFLDYVWGLVLTQYVGTLPIANLILKTSFWIVSLSLLFGRRRLIYWRDWKRIKELDKLVKNLSS